MSMELPDFSSVHVLVVGDVMLDRYIWGGVERISPEAPIPVVHVRERTCRLGGAGNVAANLAGLECQTTLAGVVGADAAAGEIAGLLSDQGIIDACRQAPGLPTVAKTRIIAGAQQVVRLDEERPEQMDAAAREAVREVFEKSLSGVHAVVLSDYGKGLLEDGFLRRCISACREKGVPVFVDPKNADWRAYAGSTCITPNLKEFSRACEKLSFDPADQEQAGRALISHYNLDCLLLTRGKAGMSLLSGKAPACSVPSAAREVFDVSGAGDTVIALMAAGAAAGLSMEQAMRLANLAAGEVVGHVGTYAASRGDLLRALAQDSGRENRYAACSRSQAAQMVAHWQKTGQKVVFTNGCFDILHPGHIALLQRARLLGDRLVVGLNTDASIQRIKGPSRPVLAEQDRAAILAALECVDLVVCFDEDTPIELLKALRPDVLAKGSDYSKSGVVGADLVESWGGRVELVQLLEGQSTSGILEKIRGNDQRGGA